MKAFGVPSSIAHQHLAAPAHTKKPGEAAHFPLRRHDIICESTVDAVKRLVVPSVTRAAWREAVLEAEEAAIGVFSNNLKSLLLTPPLRVIRHLRQQETGAGTMQRSDAVICGVDPGLKQGHKVVYNPLSLTL
jgi:transcriptional accessory protein Tex/SPT6